MAKFTVDARTQVAAICAFDPAALPKDFDDRLEFDPERTIDELSSQGRFWWEDTGGTGNYVCQINIDEPYEFTQSMHARIFDQSEFLSIACPSGKFYVCGAEYAARNPRKRREVAEPSYLGPATKCLSIPPGTHQLRVTQIAHDEIRPFEPNRPNYMLIAQMIVTALFILGFICCFLGAGLVLRAIFDFVLAKFPVDVACECQPSSAGKSHFMMLFGVGSLFVWLGMGLSEKLGAHEKRQKAQHRKIDKVRRKLPDYVFEIKTAPALAG